jgi:transposase-like protein
MGREKRNHYTKEFKFKVALEAIKGERQLSEIAAEYKVHPTMISNWKRQLLEHGAEIFATNAQKSEQDHKDEDLVHTIGYQQLQIDWLKKKLGLSDNWRSGI